MSKPISSLKPIQRVLSKLAGVTPDGPSWKAQCPAHSDHNRSLRITEHTDGCVDCECLVGCSAKAILDAIGLAESDLNPQPQIIAEHDYRDERGELLFQTVWYDTRQRRLRKPKAGGDWTWNLNGVRRVLYRLPELVRSKPEQPVFLCPKEHDADRLAEAFGLVATTSPMEPRKWDPEFSPLFKERRVVIVADNDEPGDAHATMVAQELSGAAEWVRILRLPGHADGGVSGWIDAGGSKAELRKLVKEIPSYDPNCRSCAESGSLITIHLTYERESQIVDRAIDALAVNCDQIFQRTGMGLCHIVREADVPSGTRREADAPHIAKLKSARIAELLGDVAVFVKQGKNTLEIVPPPPSLVAKIIARDAWPDIPRIDGVTETPILRADGSILQKLGYDPQTGIWYAPRVELPPIPEHPMLADAKRARDELLETVADFPFASPIHRATWLAASLTPLARWAFDGCTPLFLIDANIRGSGKGLLADVALLIATGRVPARLTAPRDDGEWRKRITASALRGDTVVLIDNIAGSIGSPSLDAALTATSWSDRVLGESRMTGKLPLYVTWIATGNNCEIAGDTSRRTALIRLRSDHETPEDRRDFKYPQLREWIRQNRPRLVVAALTILRAWHVAGCPDQDLPAWGSFEEWSKLIRNVVVWIGMPDPYDARMELRQSDRGVSELRALIRGWEEVAPDGMGISVAAMLDLVKETSDRFPTLYSVLREMSTSSDGLPSAQSVGMKLRHARKRIIDGKYFDSIDRRRGGVKWVVRQVNDNAGLPGLAGLESAANDSDTNHGEEL